MPLNKTKPLFNQVEIMRNLKYVFHIMFQTVLSMAFFMYCIINYLFEKKQILFLRQIDIILYTIFA